MSQAVLNAQIYVYIFSHLNFGSLQINTLISGNLGTDSS